MLLAALAFLQAYFLYPVMFDRRVEPEGLPPDVNLPEAGVRVYVAYGDPAFLLKSPLDLDGANDLREADLDRSLFPGGGRHRYYHLHAFQAGTSETVIDLASEPVRLENGTGAPVTPVDLEGAFRSRRLLLSPALRFYLAQRLPAGGRLVLGPGDHRTVLVAYRIAEVPDEPSGARQGDRRFRAENLRKDDLDDRMQFPRLLKKKTDS